MSGHDSTASGFLYVDAESKAPYSAEELDGLTVDSALVIAKYPQKRSALLPLLHLVQSVDGYITGRGVTFCAEQLDLTEAEVSGVATFYTQYKRHPNGEFTVGVCTNTLCAVMGGDQIFDTVSEHLGVGHDETTDDGRVTLERIECNAACDYAPVVMANWEFFDNQTPASAVRLVDDLRAGAAVKPTRGADEVVTFKAVSRVLAGFNDGRGHQGVGAGPASLLGLGIAKERDWVAPGDAHRDGSVAHERQDAGSSEGATEPVATATTPGAMPAAAPDGAPASATDAGPTASKNGAPTSNGSTGATSVVSSPEPKAASGPEVPADDAPEPQATLATNDHVDVVDDATAPEMDTTPELAVEVVEVVEVVTPPEVLVEIVEVVESPEATVTVVAVPEAAVEVVEVAQVVDEAQAPTVSRDSLITGMPAWSPDVAPAPSAPQYTPARPASERFDAVCEGDEDNEADEANEATVRRSDLSAATGSEARPGANGPLSGSPDQPDAPIEPLDEADAATVLRSNVNPTDGAAPAEGDDLGQADRDDDEDVDGKDPR